MGNFEEVSALLKECGEYMGNDQVVSTRENIYFATVNISAELLSKSMSGCINEPFMSTFDKHMVSYIFNKGEASRVSLGSWTDFIKDVVTMYQILGREDGTYPITKESKTKVDFDFLENNLQHDFKELCSMYPTAKIDDSRKLPQKLRDLLHQISTGLQQERRRMIELERISESWF